MITLATNVLLGFWGVRADWSEIPLTATAIATLAMGSIIAVMSCITIFRLRREMTHPGN